MIWKRSAAWSTGILFAVLTWLPPTPTQAATGKPPSLEQLTEHLTRLEQVLVQHRLVQHRLLAMHLDPNRPGLQNDLEGEVADLQTHLRLLEPYLDSLAEDDAMSLRLRLDALKTQTRDLTLAAEEPKDKNPGGSQATASQATPTPTPKLRSRSEAPAPVNDACGSALPIGNGTFNGDLSGTTQDGQSSCSGISAHDLWYRYTAPADGLVSAYLEESFDKVISIHAGCPGTVLNEMTCSSQTVRFEASAGEEFLIRVVGTFEEAFTLHVAPPGSISGTVTDAVTSEPLAASVQLTSDHGGNDGQTDAAGAYHVLVDRPGTYFLATGNTPVHLDEYYDNIPCEDFCYPTTGTPIEVGSGVAVTDIDVALDRLGSITGRITDALTGQPISSAG